jgi:hypothetical protein
VEFVSITVIGRKTMNKFSKVLVSAAFLAVSTFGVMPASANAATTASKCDAHGIGNKTLTHSTDNTAYKIDGSKATVTFDVSNCTDGIDVSIIAWKAPNGTDGKPYAQQTMFAHDTKHFANGRHTMTIALPDCFNERQVAFMHGGSKSCTVKPTKPAETPKPTPTTPVTPTPVTPTPTVQATELPHTGPEAMVGTFLGVSGAGTLMHRYVSRKSRR